MGRDEYPETVNIAYKLFVRTSRKFGGSILRVRRRKFRSECRRGGRISVMFTQ